MTIASNKLNQSKDIAGSRNQDSSLNVMNESLKLGSPIQSGIGASISGTAPDMIVSGLSGLTNASTCRYLTLSEADSVGNNGTFQIIEVLSATSAVISNASGVAGDANDGYVEWVERRSYSLEDDLNYERSDRENIKGVGYDELVPTYVRPEDVFTEIPANLANIAGKTTDAKSLVDNLKFQTISVFPGDTFVTLNSLGNLKHADVNDTTGVPVNDGYDVGNVEATFVAILDDDGYATELTVANGLQKGWRIFGRTRAGSSISPNSVEIEFRAVELGSELSTSVPYVWEASQPREIDVIIGYRTSIYNLDEMALRKLLLFGIVYGGSSSGVSGGGGNLPSPTEYGQFLVAIDDSDTVFTPAVPVVNDEGLITVDDNGKIVVVGGV